MSVHDIIIVPIHDLKQQFPLDWQTFVRLLPSGVTIDHYADCLLYGETDVTISDSDMHLLNQARQELEDAFYQRYEVSLSIDHHDATHPMHDYGHDIDGAFFTIPFNQVYQYTYEAVAMAEELPIARSHIVLD